MNYEEVAQGLFKELRSNTSMSLIEVLNDFSKGEVGVLSYLAFDNDKATSGELSEKLNVTTARIAKILNSLENKGYIKRKMDLFDKRKTLVTITDSGKKLAIEAKDEIINKIIKVVKIIGYEKIDEYVKIALEIKKVLNEQ